MNVDKIVNELRKINKGVEIRYLIDLYRFNIHTTEIFIDCDIDKLKVTSDCILVENVMILDYGKSINIKSVYELTPGMVYPNVDIHEEITTVDSMAVMLQKINPEIVFMLTDNIDEIYYISNEDINLPVDFNYISDDAISSETQLFLLKEFVNEDINYYKTSQEILLNQSKAFYEDRRRIEKYNGELVKRYSFDSPNLKSNKRNIEDVINKFDKVTDIINKLNITQNEKDYLIENIVETTKVFMDESINLFDEKCNLFIISLLETMLLAAITTLILNVKNQELSVFIEQNKDAFTSIEDFKNLIGNLGLSTIFCMTVTLSNILKNIKSFGEVKSSYNIVRRVYSSIERDMQLSAPIIKRRVK